MAEFYEKRKKIIVDNSEYIFDNKNGKAFKISELLKGKKRNRIVNNSLEQPI